MFNNAKKYDKVSFNLLPRPERDQKQPGNSPERDRKQTGKRPETDRNQTGKRPDTERRN